MSFLIKDSQFQARVQIVGVCSASKSEQEREKKRGWGKGEGLRTGGRGMRERVRLSSFPLLLPLSQPLPLLFFFSSLLSTI